VIQKLAMTFSMITFESDLSLWDVGVYVNINTKQLFLSQLDSPSSNVPCEHLQPASLFAHPATIDRYIPSLSTVNYEFNNEQPEINSLIKEKWEKKENENKEIPLNSPFSIFS
jgi:hypothetical protein